MTVSVDIIDRARKDAEAYAKKFDQVAVDKEEGDDEGEEEEEGAAADGGGASGGLQA